MTSDQDTPQEPGDEDPLSALFGGQVPPEMREALQSMGLDKMDPAMMRQMQAQIHAMMSSTDEGPVNADLSRDTARAVVAQAGDTSLSARNAADVDQVVQVATLWLDAVTDFAPPSGGAAALSRSEWVEQTLPVWRTLTAPVAEGVRAAMTSAMQQQMGELGEAETLQIPGMPPGMNPSQLMSQMEPMMQRMSSAMFGAQVGQAVGTLAGEIVSGTEVGLPLLPAETVALLPANVAEFAEGLEVDAGEVHLYLAVREAARVRLFAEVGWLGPQLLTAVQEYARDIRIDTEAIEAAVRSVDPSDPAAMQEALSGSLFTPEPSPAQKVALTRLETFLALVEGWVDLVSERACAGHLPQVPALSEAVRRRRATGGPAEKVFASLVGLELRPRRLRDAANLWAALEDAHGPAARDGAWAHPDLAPDAADLDDILGYVERAGGSGDQHQRTMDEELDKLLSDSDPT
ncbi:MAG TPA: zinc-dependent metalloprotease [Ornithinimicrobium sp.]|uniref:zinc-dependent metalloprotease n=1 Tax=Ornithinimicrobium sp. TaxID=1977084 RepID=UPI002B4855BE|nr:zinc-dependent metalloprotease [Ornithinimicrobium sp.]HKJ13150.1 zinc-dependent metalloprotease [Ornithinimicrobium sp.]